MALPDTGSDRPRRRERTRLAHVSPGRLLVLVVLLVVVSRVLTDAGGVQRWIEEVVQRGQELVASSTEDPSLGKAEEALNARFERVGSYPVVTEAALRDDPELSWGVGVSVIWCQPRAVVLTAMTGRGTISRLLLDGKTVGDVQGSVACPLDVTNPAPWEAP